MQEPINCTEKELSTYLRALAAGYLPTSCWDTGPSAPSKSMRIAEKCYRNGPWDRRESFRSGFNI